MSRSSFSKSLAAFVIISSFFFWASAFIFCAFPNWSSASDVFWLDFILILAIFSEHSRSESTICQPWMVLCEQVVYLTISGRFRSKILVLDEACILGRRVLLCVQSFADFE